MQRAGSRAGRDDFKRCVGIGSNPQDLEFPCIAPIYIPITVLEPGLKNTSKVYNIVGVRVFLGTEI
jgi:hypothetical protein